MDGKLVFLLRDPLLYQRFLQLLNDQIEFKRRTWRLGKGIVMRLCKEGFDVWDKLWVLIRSVPEVSLLI